MSIALVRHFWRTNHTQILNNSVAHCHARGLHSLCLLDEPGKRIRMFVAGLGHDMSCNRPESTKPLSIGFHSHHCDIQIEVLRGLVGNRVLVDGDEVALSTYRHRSKLRGEQPGFELVEAQRGFSSVSELLHPSDTVDMRAQERHTVWVDTVGAAWIVYEGQEDPAYDPLTWSDADLTAFNFEGMYQPMSEQQVTFVIETVIGDEQRSYDFSSVGIRVPS